MKVKFLLTIIFCLVVSMAHSQLKGFKESLSEEVNAQKPEKTAASVWLEEYFADRPAAPGPEVESFKENLPVKKESFTAKLERFKKEGFKVAVILSSPPTTTKAPTTTGGTMDSNQIMLDGSLPSMQDEFVPLLESFTTKLNEAFNTDIFENVDLKTIPFREVKIGKVDDWELTIYRMVFTLSITPKYDYQATGKMTGDLQFEATYYVTTNVIGVEYVNEKKGVKIRYPVRTGNLGSYKSDLYKTEANPSINTVEDLHSLVKPLTGSELVSFLQKEQDDNMAKFIEKRKK